MNGGGRFTSQRFCVSLDICRHYPCARPAWWNLLSVNAEFLGQLFGTGRYALPFVSKRRPEAWTRGLAHDGPWERELLFWRWSHIPFLARLAYYRQYLPGNDYAPFLGQDGEQNPVGRTLDRHGRLVRFYFGQILPAFDFVASSL